MLAIIWHMTTRSPGMKKFALRVSGLKRIRGLASIGIGLVPRIVFIDS